jgi:hypothetical protein
MAMDAVFTSLGATHGSDEREGLGISGRAIAGCGCPMQVLYGACSVDGSEPVAQTTRDTARSRGLHNREGGKDPRTSDGRTAEMQDAKRRGEKIIEATRSKRAVDVGWCVYRSKRGQVRLVEEFLGAWQGSLDYDAEGFSDRRKSTPSCSTWTQCGNNEAEAHTSIPLSALLYPLRLSTMDAQPLEQQHLTGRLGMTGMPAS